MTLVIALLTAISFVTVNAETGQVAITGTDLTAQGAPVVTLPGYPALTVTSASATAVVANLPANIQAGTYMLKLASGNQRCYITVTIGVAASPEMHAPSDAQEPPWFTEASTVDGATMPARRKHAGIDGCDGCGSK